MQTFLPYPSYVRSAEALDPKRLVKQMPECKQILRAIENPGYGYQHHPAVTMWRGYERSLCDYATAIVSQWKFRSGRTLAHDEPLSIWFKNTQYRWAKKHRGSIVVPPWLGDESFHMSHRSNLHRKDPQGYLQFKQDPSLMPYLWPFSTPGGNYKLRVSAADGRRLLDGTRILPAKLSEYG